MARRIHANGKTIDQARHNITVGIDTDKNIIVETIFYPEIGNLEAKEFRKHKADALRAAEWFRAQQVELVIIKRSANYHMLFFDTLREGCRKFLGYSPDQVPSHTDVPIIVKFCSYCDVRNSNFYTHN